MAQVHLQKDCLAFLSHALFALDLRWPVLNLQALQLALQNPPLGLIFQVLLLECHSSSLSPEAVYRNYCELLRKQRLATLWFNDCLEAKKEKDGVQLK